MFFKNFLSLHFQYSICFSSIVLYDYLIYIVFKQTFIFSNVIFMLTTNKILQLFCWSPSLLGTS
jgi:hypothetical protein